LLGGDVFYVVRAEMLYAGDLEATSELSQSLLRWQSKMMTRKEFGCEKNILYVLQ
jgi:hypothetical protein